MCSTLHNHDGQELVDFDGRLAIIVQRNSAQETDSITQVQWTAGSSRFRTRNPFTQGLPRVALMPAGLWVAGSEVWRLDRYDSAGTLQSSWQQGIHGQKIGRRGGEMVLHLLRGRIPALQTSQYIELAPTVRSGIAQTRIPVITRVLIDGNLTWVQTPIDVKELASRDAFVFEREGYGSDGWNGYADDGRRVAQLELPTDFHVRRIVNGTFWGYRITEDDAEYVERIDAHSLIPTHVMPRRGK